MAVKLQRPILVGGVGLTFALWMLESFQHSLSGLGTFTTLGALAAGASVWFFQKRAIQSLDLPERSTRIERATVEQAIVEAENAIAYLETEAKAINALEKVPLAQLRDRTAHLTAELDRRSLQIAVLGGKASGKTALVQVLTATWIPQVSQTITFKDTPGLFAATQSQAQTEPAIADALTADLTLFVTTGDLTDSEFQVIKQLEAANQRTVLVFNKQDQYLPTERPIILRQLRERLQDVLKPDDVVAIATMPAEIKVRQYQADGSAKEWMEQAKPEVAVLTERLQQILAQELQELVWRSTLRTASKLRTEVQANLNQVRRDRAMPLIEQFQWIAGATAFANPVPVLDMLAATAITTQMVIELSGIYQQKFSLKQAQAIAGTMASLLLKLGLVEISTQTVGAVFKSNAITFVAGGLVQGVSAAYLTRLAGLSLIEYFETQPTAINAAAENPLSLDRLSQTLRNTFQQNQQVALVQSFVMQAVRRLLPEPASANLAVPSAEPLQLPTLSDPLVPLEPIPLNLKPEAEPLLLAAPEMNQVEENRSEIRLPLPSLESTSLPSS